MDNCCNTGNSVAAWPGDQLHNGRAYSHCAGGCHYCCDSRFYSEAMIGGSKKSRVKIDPLKAK